MAKCRRCNKSGLFLKVNAGGFCKECERILVIEAAEKRINGSTNKCNRFPEKKEVSIDNELQLLEKQVIEKKQELQHLDYEIIKYDKNITAHSNKLKKMREAFNRVDYTIKNFYDNNQIPNNGDIINDEMNELLGPAVELKLHCMDVKSLRKLYNKNYKDIQETLSKYQSRYTTKTNAAIYKLMVVALEAELQNVLYNINYGKLDTAIENIKKITSKYLYVATDGNQNIAPTMIKFIGEIEYLFIEAVKIEYEYYVQKERIKEEQRAIREQMRQEATERKILEQQRKQVEKEEEKYKNEISSIAEQISNTDDSNKIMQLKIRIEQLQNQLLDVEHKKEEILSRQNGKAGYIYIISNMGSFGNNVFKVGMTRRLDPQDRVNELGDASVPFPFDVHSFIFSDDAVSLEQNMHKILKNNRVNRVNLRKEFFKATIDELEELVYSLEPSAEFNRTVLAEQYNQSLSIDEVPDDGETVNLDDDEFNDYEV
jgi:predicted  nucleic acid-binding Zn-ribbon protein